MGISSNWRESDLAKLGSARPDTTARHAISPRALFTGLYTVNHPILSAIGVAYLFSNELHLFSI
jgi:hypothetical protein